MAETTLRTIDELLDGVMDEVDDSEAKYKLRSARQLLAVLQERNDNLDEAIEDAVDEEEVIQNLRELGYMM